jgi:hypothetical protein
VSDRRPDNAMSITRLIIERAVSADMVDGQSLPPFNEHGAIWHIVHRERGKALWRRIRLAPSAALHSVGCDWHDLMAGLLAAAPRHDNNNGENADWRVMREFCAEHGDLLSLRERDFVNDLKRWKGNLTEKQFAWLAAIYGRLRRHAA